jgi:hypothetical protein
MFTRYLWQLGAVLAAILAAVATLNALVDTSGSYRLGLLELGDYKEGQGSRDTKAEQLTWQRWDTVLLGSSRVAQGLRSDDPAFGARRVYNAGLAGAKYRETSRVLNHVLEHAPPKSLWIFVDFFAFSALQRDNPEFGGSRFAASFDPLEFHARHLLGYGATRDSLRSLLNARRQRAAAWSERGDWVSDALHERPPADVFGFMLRMHVCSEDWYRDFRYDPALVQQLRRDVERARRQGVEAVVIIPPVHALQLEAEAELGLWPTLERWKREMVTALAQNGPVWDFTECGTECDEPVPGTHSDGDAATMRWFYDSSHFKPVLGQRVIARVLGEDETLGSPLTPDTLDTQLALERERHDRYMRSHDQELAWIRSMHAECGGTPGPRGQQPAIARRF